MLWRNSSPCRWRPKRNAAGQSLLDLKASNLLRYLRSMKGRLILMLVSDPSLTEMTIRGPRIIRNEP